MAKKSLVVCLGNNQDDDIAGWLSEAGYTVSAAESGGEALDIAGSDEAPFRLLVSGDTLPDMELCDFFKRIISMGGKSPAFRLAVLGEGSAKESLEGLIEAGLDDFIVRPVSRAVFLKKLTLAEMAVSGGRGKNELVSALLPGIVHEINNPAAFVLGNLSMMEGSLEDIKEHMRLASSLVDCLSAGEGSAVACGDELSAYREFVQDSALDEAVSEMADMVAECIEGMGQMDRMLSALRDFALYTGDEQPGETDIHGCIDSALMVMKNRIKYKAQVSKEYEELPGIEGVSGGITHAFVVVLANAVDAIEDTGMILIRTGLENGNAAVEVRVDGCAPGVTGPRLPGTDIGVAREIFSSHGASLETGICEGGKMFFRVVFTGK